MAITFGSLSATRYVGPGGKDLYKQSLSASYRDLGMVKHREMLVFCPTQRWDLTTL